MEGLGLSVEDRRKEGRQKTYVLHFTRYALLCLFLIGTASGLTEEKTIDYIIAVVNDQPITRRELENELIIRKIKNPSNPVKRAVLEELIERKLMLQKADDIGILLWSWKKKVNAEIQAMKSKYPEFFEELKQRGLEYQELEELLTNDLIIEELIVRQFRSSIDDEQMNQEAAQYFEQNQAEFIEPIQLQFQYILVLSGTEDEELAETIVSELKAGTTFQEIRQAYNPFVRVVEDPRKFTDDTDAGPDPEIFNWSLAVANAVANLEIGEVSQPIPTSEGSLIVRLLEKKLPRQKMYPEVSEQIKEQLIWEELEKQKKAWLVEQKEAGDIRILDVELAKIP